MPAPPPVTPQQRFQRLQVGSSQPEIVQKFPAVPEDVKQRFPSMKDYEDRVEQWRVKTNIALRGGPV